MLKVSAGLYSLVPDAFLVASRIYLCFCVYIFVGFSYYYPQQIFSLIMYVILTSSLLMLILLAKQVILEVVLLQWRTSWGA